MTGIDLSGGRNGKAPVVKLSSGCDLPVVGLGTYSLHGNACVNAVRTALECGYRLIDTASMYGNEREVGEVVRASGVPREEIVVQTKLYSNQYGHAARAIKECLRKLGLGCIDILLLHHRPPTMWPPTGPLSRPSRMRRSAPQAFHATTFRNWMPSSPRWI